MSQPPTQALDRKTLNWLLVAALGLALAGSAAFLVDLHIAHFMTLNPLPGEIYEIVQLCEVFAHGWGVFFILLSVWILDPDQRPRMPRLLATVLLPVFAIHLCKFLVVRARPRTFGVNGVLELPENVWETFHPFSLDLSTMTESSLQSWPSGHTASAVGLAVGLSWFYPRGRWLFGGLAAVSALQRVTVNAHFFSDTCFAAAISLCALQICHRSNWLSRWYDRLEHRASAARQVPESLT